LHEKTRMGDTILTPRRTASILRELERATRSVNEARRELIEAMADRKRPRTESRAKPVRRPQPR
jgi:hypothetical protein